MDGIANAQTANSSHNISVKLKGMKGKGRGSGKGGEGKQAKKVTRQAMVCVRESNVKEKEMLLRIKGVQKRGDL